MKKRNGFIQCIDSNNTLSYNLNSCQPYLHLLFSCLLLLLLLWFYLLVSLFFGKLHWWRTKMMNELGRCECERKCVYDLYTWCCCRAIQYLKQRIANDVHCHFYIVKCISEIRTCIEFNIFQKRKRKKNKHRHILFQSKCSMWNCKQINIAKMYMVALRISLFTVDSIFPP